MRSSIEVLGARSEVTGSRIKYTSEQGTQILIDCGMYQGTEDDDIRNHRSLDDCNPEKLSAILLTHAHLDHCGLLPILATKSKAPTYATFATRDAASIILKNSDFLSDGKLYPKGSVDAALKRIVPVEYDTPFNIDGVNVTFEKNGHVLGSSSIRVQGQDRNKEVVLFSGDIGNPESRTVRPAKPNNQGADIVVMEMTYGDRVRPTEDPVEIFMEVVERIRKTGGTAVVPSFAFDRSTNVGGIFKELSRKKLLRTKNGRHPIPVYFDGQMQYHTTKLYGFERYRELLNDKLRALGDPLDFPEMRIIYRREESLAIRNHNGPKIIIPGGGMMIGGRGLRHAADYLPGKDNVFLLVGYSGEKTLGRQIAEGEKRVYIKEYGTVDVDATILQTSSLSAHADQNQLLDWLGHVQGGNRRLRALVPFHADEKAQKAFTGRAADELGITNVLFPKKNEPIFL